MSKTDGNRRKRDTTRATLAALRDAGATAATLHPDGSVASVTFAAPSPVPTPAAPQPTGDVIKEVLARPWPKTDIDALNSLPDYDEENGN